MSSDEEKDDFVVRRSELKRSVSSSTSVNLVLDEYSNKEAKRIGYNSNCIKVINRLIFSPKIELLTQKLKTPSPFSR